MENRGFFTATFNIDIAKKYGTDAAIMLQNIQYWCDKNRANDKHFYNGSYWMYNSAKAFTIMFPYLSKRQIETILKKLIKHNLIKVDNFNKTTYDRTSWYSVNDLQSVDETPCNRCVTSKSPNREMEVTNQSLPSSQTVTPIPNTLHTLPKDNQIEGFDDFLKFVNSLYERKFVGDATSKRHFKANLKEGWTVEDMKKAVANVKQDQWHKSKNYSMCSPEYLIRPSNMNKFVNMGNALVQGDMFASETEPTSVSDVFLHKPSGKYFKKYSADGKTYVCMKNGNFEYNDDGTKIPFEA